MKVHYKHLLEKIHSKPKLNELSDRFFQLGHEHEIINDIFDFELTPNRGDCLSLNGLLRDLKLFYDIEVDDSFYSEDINQSDICFTNNAKNSCNKISFLKIEIDEVPHHYDDGLEKYFKDLDIKKNNFFTDISNYISYETGQPTHCYDSRKLGNTLVLDKLDKDTEFCTLLGQTINIRKGDLVFYNKNKEVINLAGIIGGEDTACSKDTKSVVVECAYFNPEAIVGKSILYDMKSDASHKFERNTDPLCHEYILRRFIKVAEQNTNIKKIEIFSESYSEFKPTNISCDLVTVNKILGTKIHEKDFSRILKRLGFTIKENIIKVPSYRHDIANLNDISEEIARAIGYDNIKSKSFEINLNNNINDNFEENKLKALLIENGFSEVINSPFESNAEKDSIVVDNPLDSNRQFLRTNLKDSLIKNLLYNERRQQDSVKLFEISDIYVKPNSKKRILGVVASGRVDKNYLDFSKKINNNYLDSIFNDSSIKDKLKLIDISRESVKSKLKNQIVYGEMVIDSSLKVDRQASDENNTKIKDYKYLPISEYPSSTRDISFSIKDFSKLKILDEVIDSFRHELIKEIFIFDYFNNTNTKEIKIGYRFILQSKQATITDSEVNEVMNELISKALSINSVSVPGLA
tara:strand:- start:3840 stop:5744 length:1905 start_codon:yes stop_codon:yes gene_type:complete